MFKLLSLAFPSPFAFLVLGISNYSNKDPKVIGFADGWLLDFDTVFSKSLCYLCQ